MNMFPGSHWCTQAGAPCCCLGGGVGGSSCCRARYAGGPHEGRECLCHVKSFPYSRNFAFPFRSCHACSGVFEDEVMVKEGAMGTGLGMPGQTREGGAGAHVGLVIPGESAFLKEKELGKGV